MKIRALWLFTVGIAVAGCTGSTDVSRQPTQAEIQQGVERRLADVDKMSSLSPEAKERMKAQIRGSRPGAGR